MCLCTMHSPKTRTLTRTVSLRCLELAKRGGWKVYATARDPRKMKGLEGVPNIVTRTLDVTQDKQITSVVAEVVEAEGRIDCVVNNAGGMCIGMCDLSCPRCSPALNRASSDPIVDVPPSVALGKPEPISISYPQAS